MRIIGVDYGRARIGVALGDTETRIASAWLVFENKGAVDSIKKLIQIAHDEDAHAFVIGIPRPLANQQRTTKQAEEIKIFAQKLSKESSLLVHEENETLSTALAAVQVRERGERGKRDDLAAAVILQTYLDRK